MSCEIRGIFGCNFAGVCGVWMYLLCLSSIFVLGFGRSISLLFIRIDIDRESCTSS